ncbi:MAG: GGDEF domain-containing protein [Tahibacter sp.]
MTVFDIRTAMLLTATITLMLAVCLMLTLRQHEEPVGGAVAIWVRGTAIQPLAWLLLSFRDFIPDAGSILLGNLLICFAYAEYPRALRKFTGNQRAGNLPRWIAACSVIPVVFFTWIEPSVSGRVVSTSLIVLCLWAMAARAALGAAKAPRPASYSITAATFLFGAALLLVRALFEAFNPAPLVSGVQVTPMQSLIFSYTALAPVIATFGFVLMCSDRTRAELERLAATDSLTGVLNRRMLEQLVVAQLADAQRHLRPLAALLLDADHFKRINDEHGHDVGDSALRELVNAVRAQLRPGDLIGRLGGEEFLVVLTATSSEESLRVAERLRASVVALDLRDKGIQVPLSISVGVAMLPDRSCDFTDLVRRADAAMYQAKNKGRNRVEMGGPTAPVVLPSPLSAA